MIGLVLLILIIYRAEAAYSDKRDPKVKHDDKVFEPLGSGLSDFGKVSIVDPVGSIRCKVDC